MLEKGRSTVGLSGEPSSLRSSSPSVKSSSYYLGSSSSPTTLGIVTSRGEATAPAAAAIRRMSALTSSSYVSSSSPSSLLSFGSPPPTAHRSYYSTPVPLTPPHVAGSHAHLYHAASSLSSASQLPVSTTPAPLRRTPPPTTASVFRSEDTPSVQRASVCAAGNDTSLFRKASTVARSRCGEGEERATYADQRPMIPDLRHAWIDGVAKPSTLAVARHVHAVALTAAVHVGGATATTGNHPAAVSSSPRSTSRSSTDDASNGGGTTSMEYAAVPPWESFQWPSESSSLTSRAASSIMRDGPLQREGDAHSSSSIAVADHQDVGSAAASRRPRLDSNVSMGTASDTAAIRRRSEIPGLDVDVVALSTLIASGSSSPIPRTLPGNAPLPQHDVQQHAEPFLQCTSSSEPAPMMEIVEERITSPNTTTSSAATQASAHVNAAHPHATSLCSPTMPKVAPEEYHIPMSQEMLMAYPPSLMLWRRHSMNTTGTQGGGHSEGTGGGEEGDRGEETPDLARRGYEESKPPHERHELTGDRISSSPSVAAARVKASAADSLPTPQSFNMDDPYHHQQHNHHGGISTPLPRAMTPKRIITSDRDMLYSHRTTMQHLKEAVSSSATLQLEQQLQRTSESGRYHRGRMMALNVLDDAKNAAKARIALEQRISNIFSDENKIRRCLVEEETIAFRSIMVAFKDEHMRIRQEHVMRIEMQSREVLQDAERSARDAILSAFTENLRRAGTLQSIREALELLVKVLEPTQRQRLQGDTVDAWRSEIVVPEKKERFDRLFSELLQDEDRERDLLIAFEGEKRNAIGTAMVIDRAESLQRQQQRIFAMQQEHMAQREALLAALSNAMECLAAEEVSLRESIVTTFTEQRNELAAAEANATLQRFLAMQAAQRLQHCDAEVNARQHMVEQEAQSRDELFAQIAYERLCVSVSCYETRCRGEIEEAQRISRDECVRKAQEDVENALLKQREREALESKEAAAAALRRRAQASAPFLGFSLAERVSQSSLDRRQTTSSTSTVADLVVDSLVVGGPAFTEGLQLSDRLVSIGGGLQPTSLSAVRQAIGKNAVVGSTFEMVVKRKKPTMTSSVANSRGESLENTWSSSVSRGMLEEGGEDALASTSRSLAGGMDSITESPKIRPATTLLLTEDDVASQESGSSASPSSFLLPQRYELLTFRIPVKTVLSEFASIAEWFFTIEGAQKIERDAPTPGYNKRTKRAFTEKLTPSAVASVRSRVAATTTSAVLDVMTNSTTLGAATAVTSLPVAADADVITTVDSMVAVGGESPSDANSAASSPTHRGGGGGGPLNRTTTATPQELQKSSATRAAAPSLAEVPGGSTVASAIRSPVPSSSTKVSSSRTRSSTEVHAAAPGLPSRRP